MGNENDIALLLGSLPMSPTDFALIKKDDNITIFNVKKRAAAKNSYTWSVWGHKQVHSEIK